MCAYVPTTWIKRLLVMQRSKSYERLVTFCSRSQGWEFSSSSKSNLTKRFLLRGAGNRECRHESGARIDLKNYELVGRGDVGERGG